VKRWIPLAVNVVALLVALSIDDPRLHYPLFLVAHFAAGIAWIALVDNTRKGPPEPDLLRGGLAAAIVLLAIAVARAPGFSDDVFRYVYEGRVVWRMGPAFPFLHPPADAPSQGVPPSLLDAAWSQINHPDLSTIYPPFAAAVFAIAGGLGDLIGGGHLVLLKLLLVAACFATAWFSSRTPSTRPPAAESKGSSRKEGRGPLRPGSEGTWLLLSPLTVLEIGRDGHADALAALGMAIGIFGFLRLRPRVGYAGFALAALAKLNGFIAFVAAVRATRRGLVIGLAIASLVLVPVVVAGRAALGSLFEYATRWRAGDGAFTILLAIAEAILGGDWTRIGDFTVTRHQLARGLAFAVFGALSFFALRRRFPIERVPEKAGLVLLFLLLLSPTLHPWYVVWLLPFVPFAGPARRAMIALAVLAPLLHHPAHIERVTGEWTDLFWVRALVHGPVWILLATDLFRVRRVG
jgi:hypothetical protein